MRAQSPGGGSPEMRASNPIWPLPLDPSMARYADGKGPVASTVPPDLVSCTVPAQWDNWPHSLDSVLSALGPHLP